MVNWSTKQSYDGQDLMEIVRILRHPGGCPWDQEQTHRSIRRNLLEEACEAAEAIDNDDVDGLKEELGDVLLQVYFHTSIEEDAGRFTLDDVADGVCKKLIYRHPHVFGDVTVDSTDQVLSNWEELKKKEKHQETQADAVDAVARTLPALWRAEKTVSKTAKAGFNWSGLTGPLDKLEEEVRELRRAVETGGEPDAPHGVREELGDLLFITAKIAQMCGVDPEEALHRACDKFDRRFRRVETAADKPLPEYTEEELTALWERAKELS